MPRNFLGTLLLIVILLTGHLAQVAAWVAAFMGVGEFDTFTVAFYHSAVNYTTLGYGDIVMSPRWRLLGPFRGGRVDAVSGVPGRPNEFYMGAVNGGVWTATPRTMSSAAASTSWLPR